MYLLGEQPAYADQLIQRLQSIPMQLLEGLQPSGSPLRLEQVDDLAKILPGNQLYIIEHGLLHALVDNRPLFYLQEGDLVGLRQGIELPSCRYSSEEPLSLIPYSPIAGGVLSGKYNGGARPDGARFSNYLKLGGRQAVMAGRYVNDKSLASTERFGVIAQDAGMSLVTLATAWSKQHDFVASTIVGATHEDQLPDIFAATDVTLGKDVLDAIDKVSKEILYPMG